MTTNNEIAAETDEVDGKSVPPSATGSPSRRNGAKPPSKGTGPQPPGPVTVSQVFGEMVWLMSQCPVHKRVSIADLEWMVMPAILLKQFRLFRDEKGKPVAFACWALVSDEVEQKLQSGNAKLEPKEWRSGDKAWIPLIVAPGVASDKVQQLIKALSPAIGNGKPLKLAVHSTERSKSAEKLH